MRVVVAAVSSATQLSGVSRHAVNLVRCLLTRSDVLTVHLILAPWQLESFRDAMSLADSRLHIHPVSMVNSALSRNLWYYADLPAIATQLGADVVHLTYPVLINSAAFQCPTIVSLHDLYPYDIPSNFGFPKVLFNRLVLEQCLRSAKVIACVSDSTRQQLAKRVSEAVFERAVRIYNCVEPAALASAHNPLPDDKRDSFIFCVAQHRRNKNILLALRVFQRLIDQGDIDSSMLLVIVGIPGPETRRIHRFVRATGLTQRVLLLSGISDCELQWCYRNCELLLAPSIVEGFGLPVAEALLAGCRIVCSDIQAFRELCGDRCHYVPLGPFAEELFAKAICQALGEDRERPLFLPQFSARVLADQYMALYKNAVSALATRSILDQEQKAIHNQALKGIAGQRNGSGRFDASRP